MYTYMMTLDEPDAHGWPVIFVTRDRSFDFRAEKVPDSLMEELPGFISLTVIGETTCVAHFRKNADHLQESAARLSAYLESGCRHRTLRPEVRIALDYIRNHPRDAITWNDLGREALLAPAYFRRIFKEETGMTLKQCLLRSRLELAVSLVRQTDLGSGEIADRVGFHQSSYFVRRFREQYGVSPLVFRKWWATHRDPAVQDQEAVRVSGKCGITTPTCGTIF